MHEDSPKTLSRASFAFLSGTFLSRVSGLGRDIATAFAFGSNAAIAAFMVAFRFANLMRRLFGEGPLTSGFIPRFEQVRADSAKEGAMLFRDLLASLSFFLVLFIAVIECVLFFFLNWGSLSADNAHILTLTMFMMPGILFVCLFGICSGLLQCERKFFLTGFAPVAFNLVWICAVCWLKGKDLLYASVFLSCAVIGAFFMQWAALVPHTFAFLKKSLSWKELFQARLFSLELRSLAKPFFLGVLGVGAVQINTALDAVFARYASLEGPAYLWYAIRVQQLPLALFGIALSTALLPPLSRAMRENGVGHYLNLIRFALRKSFSLIFPCCLAIFVLGSVGINLLYGHGDFSSEAAYQTILCLWGYGFGLVPAVFVLLLAPGFYASNEYRAPMEASIISMILNIFLSSVFVFGLGLGAFSIAVATSLCAWFNFFYLSRSLEKKLGVRLFDSSVTISFAKTAIASLVAAGTTFLVGYFFVGDPTFEVVRGQTPILFCRFLQTQLLQFLALTGTFVLFFFSYAWMLGAEEILELVPFRKKALDPQ